MNVKAELRRRGLLLLQDAKVASVATLVAGEAIRGSWWGHPRSREIYARLVELADDTDVIATRLIAKKVTFVHRKLWPALIGVAMSRAPWQTRGLSTEARKLLASVKRQGTLRAKGKPTRELQERLLLHAREVHTESGRHEIELRMWKAWLEEKGDLQALPLPEAREALERATVAIGGRETMLPWRA